MVYKKLYKSLPKDMAPHGHKFRKGVWYHEDGIKICERGFHASRKAIDAIGYVACEVLALVEVKGKSEKRDDKECWSDMRIIQTHKWTKKDSVALAVYSAELVLDHFEQVYPENDSARKAIEAAKAVLAKDTQKNRSAAWAAAESAALSVAVSAAESAAWSAAEPAAWSAARSAAVSAAWAAAESAEKNINQIEKFIHKRIGF